MITSKQRSYLRKLAHDLDPLVYIGKSDLTENIFNEMDRLLESRELVKVKKFTLYRRAKEDPQIVLPR